MEQTKDYSLLRPFDLEAAKAGETICNRMCEVKTFLAVTSDGRVLVETPVACYRQEAVRMAPLCWVEGKPVYKGDVLYGAYDFGTVKVKVVEFHGPDYVKVEHIEHTHLGICTDTISYLTWNQPKVKREGWVNIYGNMNAYIYATEADANAAARANIIATARIEW